MTCRLRRPEDRSTLAAALFGLGLATLTSACAWNGAQTPPVAAAAAEAPPVEVVGMEISAEGDATRIRFEASATPQHRVSVDASSTTVTVDLRNVVVDGLAPALEVGDGTVETVTVQALPAAAGRVQVRLAAPGEVQATPAAGGLELTIRKKAVPASLAQAPAAQQRITAALPQGGGVAFDLGTEPSNLSAFPLSDGKRLVVDAEGAQLAEAQITEEFADGPVALVRMGRQEGRVRTIVEAREAGAFEGYRLESRPEGFALLLARADVPAQEVPPAETRVLQAVASPAPEAPTGGGTVADFGFRQSEDRSMIELDLSSPARHEVQEASGERVVVDLKDTTLPDRFRRALDTSAFAGPVRLVAAYPRGADTRVVVDLKQAAPFRVERDGNQLVIAFEGGSGAAATAPASPPPAEEEVIIVGGDAAGGAAPMDPTAAAASPLATLADEGYTGRRMSLDFVDADIRNVLRLIGDVSGLNVVAGDDVSGKVTVRLIDVPWDQALDVILKTRGLGMAREGNVIRIAPAERLAQEATRQQEMAKAAEEQAPLITDIIAVNYATAQELSDKVQSVLSPRGTLSIDSRTNALLIKDVAEAVDAARSLVERLDTQTPQVLIEARIVEVGSTYSRDLGVQWGGKIDLSSATGAATGWAFPHSIGVLGATGVQNYAVNFPSTGGAGGPGGAIAMSLGSVDDTVTLDLRLSAIESSGRGRVLSSPRVTTLDNKTAEISQGVEIPFTTATEEKIETSSINYLLILNVTPHVTSDGSIIMKIDVTKDAPSTTFVAVDSRTPAVETRKATTEVLVKDGATTVIGGIITETTSNTESGIPFLSKIPYLGALFRQRDKREDKTELIIFITPKIVNGGPATRSL